MPRRSPQSRRAECARGIRGDRSQNSGAKGRSKRASTGTDL